MANANISTLPINWPLLPLPDKDGGIAYPSLESSVHDSIKIILRTRPGEQLMRPLFGAGLQNFLQESNNITTRRRIHDTITESLEKWEPRVLLDRVDVAEVPGSPAQVRIDLVYRIRRTGLIQRLGLTMDLGV